MLKIFSIIIVCLAPVFASAHADMWLTWSEFDKDAKGMQIYLSRETGGQTSPIQQITQFGMNMTPVTQETAESLWMAWVDRSNRYAYRLRYARIDPHTRNLLESGTIGTTDRKIYAPSLALSRTGVPVLAWSGFDGKDSEIRFAYFENGRWSAERSVTDNTFPDTLPLVFADQEGALVLTWEQIMDDRTSVREYRVPAELSLVNQNSSLIDLIASTEITGERERVRSSTSLHQLPASLKLRQPRFFMGNQSVALQ